MDLNNPWTFGIFIYFALFFIFQSDDVFALQMLNNMDLS